MKIFKNIFILLLFWQTCFAPTSVYILNDTPYDLHFESKESGDKPLIFKRHYRTSERKKILPGNRERILRINRQKLPGVVAKKIRYYYDTEVQFYDKGQKKGAPIKLREIVTVPTLGAISTMRYGVFDPNNNKFLNAEKFGLHRYKSFNKFKWSDGYLYVLGFNVLAGSFHDVEYVFRFVKE